MTRFFIIALFLVPVLFSCSKSAVDYQKPLIGSWELVGDNCDETGNCKKEIMNDELNRNVFSDDGTYSSQKSSLRYSVLKNKITFSFGKPPKEMNTWEIISLNEKEILYKDTELNSIRKQIKSK
ncbi:MAG: hypothetical protein GY754_34775 [bacterium]|nr:hypothetical protein [bacterium]